MNQTMDSRAASLAIRRMGGQDIERVHQLDKLCFTLPWSRSSFQFDILENPHAIPLLAETPEGVLAGSAITWVIVDEAHIATLAVHPDFRRAGLARRLLAVSLLLAARAGAQSSLLEVRAGNQAALDLYSGFGYAVVGRRLRYYQDNHEDALLMTLEQIEPKNLTPFLTPADVRAGN